MIRYSLEPKHNLPQALRNLGVIVIPIVTECPRQHRTLIEYFPNEHIPDNRCTLIQVVRSTVLFSSQEYISGNRPFDPGQKLAITAEIGNANPLITTVPHQLRRDQDPSHANKSLQHMQRQARLLDLLDLHDEILAILPQPGPFRGDKYSIQKWPHGFIASSHSMLES
jgi:hypothetical protein